MLRVLIFGYKEFSQLMSSLMPEFYGKAEFKIVDAIVGSVGEIQPHVDAFQPDVVLSAGSNGAYLSSSLTMPVESLQATESDVISAITRASKVSKHVVLVNFSGPNACVPLLRENLGISITEHNYRTADEAREWFHVHRKDPDVVFVGASLICGLASQHNVPSFLQYSVESCVASLRRALTKAEDHRQYREQQALTSWLLTQSKTPIIMVDAADQGVTVNHAAQTQLQLGTDYLSDLGPFLNKVNASEDSDGDCEINKRDWWYHFDDVYINQRHCHVYQLYPKTAVRAKTETLLKPQHTLVYQSDVMESLMSQIGAYAASPSNVLVYGESGTGKELIARAIHHQSTYNQGQFVALNCSAIPTELFEGELFGYVDGAYTGARRGGRKGLIEEAEGGLLFLDEVSELALDQQAKLLRFLQERRFRPLGGNQEIAADIKLVAASNVPLKTLVEQGRFREDLYFRLNVLSISVPPLRERQQDTLLIAKTKLALLIAQYDLAFTPEQIVDEIGALLCGYQWPGNIRELENVLERILAWLHATADLNQLAGALPLIAQELYSVPVLETGTDGEQTIKSAEQQLILEAMNRFRGNKKQVAEYLGISKTTLWRRLKALETLSTQPGVISNGN